MTDLRTEIIRECERQEENCLYAATSLLIWLRRLRVWRRCFVGFQVIASSIAAYSAVKGNPLLAGGAGAIAGMSPIVWNMLKASEESEVVAMHAALQTALRDRFRRVRLIDGIKDVAVLEHSFEAAIFELNELRKASLTPPEWCFVEARRKISNGDYTNSIDEPHD